MPFMVRATAKHVCQEKSDKLLGEVRDREYLIIEITYVVEE